MTIAQWFLAPGPLVREAGLFKEAPGAVVEERGRDLLPLSVLRIPLHDQPRAGVIRRIGVKGEVRVISPCRAPGVVWRTR